jgi:uncharacterized protein
MLLLPKIDALTAPYWEGTAQGELRLQHCLACGACWHPPLPRCPICHTEAVEWRPAKGDGVLYSYTDVHHSVHTATANWVPYRICLVDLDEGPRVVSGMDYEERQPKIGSRVRVLFKRMSPEIVLPYFTPIFLPASPTV